jgi:hypothetical protein
MRLGSWKAQHMAQRIEIIREQLASCTTTGIKAGLHGLAELRSDQSFARAARALLQTCSLGRNPVDDRAAIREARALIESGHVASERDALLRVARARDPQNAEAMLRRLQRKLKKGATK